LTETSGSISWSAFTSRQTIESFITGQYVVVDGGMTLKMIYIE
jgi:hypothetical protein